MTGNDDRDGVFRVRESDGAGSGPVAQLFRDGAVARRGAVGNLAQGVPHAMLERRAEGLERQVECGAGAGEVFLELLACASNAAAGPSVTSTQPAWCVGAGPRREVGKKTPVIAVSEAVRTSSPMGVR